MLMVRLFCPAINVFALTYPILKISQLVVQLQNFHGAVEAFHVQTIDTTGAGDSFVGALLCKIVDDQSVLEVSGHVSYNNI